MVCITVLFAITLLYANSADTGITQKNFLDLIKLVDSSDNKGCKGAKILMCVIFYFGRAKILPPEYTPLDKIDAECNVMQNGSLWSFELRGRIAGKKVEEKFIYSEGQLQSTQTQRHFQRNEYQQLIKACEILDKQYKTKAIAKSLQQTTTKTTETTIGIVPTNDKRLTVTTPSNILLSDAQKSHDPEMINKQTERNADFETQTFENEVSRYELWKRLSSSVCSTNITKCVVVAALNGYSIIENVNENKRSREIHAVYDNEYSCNGIRRNIENNCMMEPSRYGIFRDLSGDSLAPNEVIHMSCGRFMSIQRFYYTGKCQINVKKEKRITIHLINQEINTKTGTICYSIYVSNRQIRTGSIQTGEQVSIPYALERQGAKLKIYCGSAVHERMYTLDTLARCVMFFEDSGSSENLARHICKFVNVYKILIISVLVIFLLALILKCGLSFILLPIYVLVTALLSLLQICLRRKTICKKCASRLYWGDPHLTCRFACSYCETFASSDYNDLYRHKKNCENIHLKISPVLILRIMLRSKFILNCINFLTAVCLIWMISSVTAVGSMELGNILNSTLEKTVHNNASSSHSLMVQSLYVMVFLIFFTGFIITYFKMKKYRTKYKKLNTQLRQLLQEAINDEEPVYNELNSSRIDNYIIAFLLISALPWVTATYNSQNFPALRTVQNLRTGDQYHFPNVKAVDLRSFVGGAHDTASGVLNTVSRLSKALDGQHDEFEDTEDFRTKPNIDDETKRLLSLLDDFSKKVEASVDKGITQAKELKATEEKIVSGLSYLNNKVQSSNKTVTDKMQDLSSQIENIDRRIENLYANIMNNPKDTDARRLYEELSQLRQTLISRSSARQPKNRKRNRRTIESHPLEKNEERTLNNDVEDKDLPNAHLAYVYRRHSNSLKSTDYLHSLYASRVMANEEICESQGLFIDTMEKDEASNKAKIKVIATMDLMPKSCMVFNLKSTDNNIKPTAVIIKILQTRVEWPIQYLYSTYKTSDIQVVSQEWCVSGGQYCRKQIQQQEKTFLQQGGIVISWDNCQNWGCDFPGCGTMNSGSCCIICRDTFIHDTEIRVYKLLQPKFAFEICLQYPGKSKCLEVASTLGKPTRSFTFSATISDIQSQFKQDSNIAIDHQGKIMFGDICNPSSYCDNFGSMQVVDGIVHGKDGHSADFICHGIGWKTYEVRSCFKNTWQLHTLLSVADSMTTKIHETKAGSVIIETGLYLGKTTWTLELDGVHLEEKSSKVDLTATLITCKGCWSCLEHAICTVEIDCNIDTAASISCQNAIAMSNHIGITFGSRQYQIILAFLYDKFEPKCNIITGTKQFEIKQSKPFWLPKGNITWQETDLSSTHKETHPENTLLWSWKSLNPFSLYGWVNWQIPVKLIIMALVLFTSLLVLMIIVKYFRLSSNIIRTIISDLKGQHNNESILDLVLMDETKKRNKYQDNVKERNRKQGIYKFE